MFPNRYPQVNYSLYIYHCPLYSPPAEGTHHTIRRVLREQMALKLVGMDLDDARTFNWQSMASHIKETPYSPVFDGILVHLSTCTCIWKRRQRRLVRVIDAEILEMVFERIAVDSTRIFFF